MIPLVGWNIDILGKVGFTPATNRSSDTPRVYLWMSSNVHPRLSSPLWLSSLSTDIKKLIWFSTTRNFRVTLTSLPYLNWNLVAMGRAPSTTTYFEKLVQFDAVPESPILFGVSSSCTSVSYLSTPAVLKCCYCRLSPYYLSALNTETSAAHCRLPHDVPRRIWMNK